MCVTPNFVWIQKGIGYMKQQKPCGSCWRCLKRRKDDFTGRCLAEAATSDWTLTVTLTYAPRDDLAEKVIHPEHFQKFVRAMRRRGHKIRYFVAGEYGKERQRAHFHAIIFGMGKVPEWTIKPAGSGSGGRSYPGELQGLQKLRAQAIAAGKMLGNYVMPTWPNEKNFHDDLWPHGHMYVEWGASRKSAGYVTKYLLEEDKHNCWFSMSKKPALGHDWFQKLAERNVKLGVLPSSFEYSPPGGEGKQYLMTGATRRDYLLAVIDGWSAKRPLDLDRLNEWVRNRVEKVLQDRLIKQLEEHFDPDQYLDNLRSELDMMRPTDEQTRRAHMRMVWLDYLQEHDNRDPLEVFAWYPVWKQALEQGLDPVAEVNKWQDAKEEEAGSTVSREEAERQAEEAVKAHNSRRLLQRSPRYGETVRALGANNWRKPKEQYDK